MKKRMSFLKRFVLRKGYVLSKLQIWSVNTHARALSHTRIQSNACKISCVTEYMQPFHPIMIIINMAGACRKSWDKKTFIRDSLSIKANSYSPLNLTSTWGHPKPTELPAALEGFIPFPCMHFFAFFSVKTSALVELSCRSRFPDWE